MILPYTVVVKAHLVYEINNCYGIHPARYSTVSGADSAFNMFLIYFEGIIAFIAELQYVAAFQSMSERL